jgi:hypothetical protein
MYLVEKAPYGFAITIADRVTKDEAVAVLEQSRSLLAEVTGRFGVLVDIRGLRPLDPEVQAVVNATQKLYFDSGLERSAVMLASAVMTLQFRRIAAESGVKQHERYVDGSASYDCEKVALAWITEGLEPPVEKAA